MKERKTDYTMEGRSKQIFKTKNLLNNSKAYRIAYGKPLLDTGLGTRGPYLGGRSANMQIYSHKYRVPIKAFNSIHFSLGTLRSIVNSSETSEICSVLKKQSQLSHFHFIF